MEPVVDTHAHLTDPRLAEDLDGVLARAAAAGVAWLVSIASDLADSERVVELAGSRAGVYATVGIHPHAADGADEPSLARVRELGRVDRVVAIGETGLDFHYDNSPRDRQRAAFRRHLELAGELDLPVVVHSRDADDDVRSIIREVEWPRGVLHCFSGGEALLEDALALGWHISFAGMITFARWDGAELLRRVPADRLLVETDSPYLAPVPHRGRRNEPAMVRLVAERAATLRGEEPAALLRATTRNAGAFYRIES